MKRPHIRFTIVFLCLCILIGGLFRIVNLLWGAPFYFHPDERNIASSISQLSFPNQMNPHFFAYGSLPIYLLYLSGVFQNFFSNTKVSFEQAILLSRLWSSILSLLLIPSLFYISRKLWNNTVALIATFLATTSIGFIQFAHFGTFEMWITFFVTWLFYSSLQLIRTKRNTYTFLCGLLLGISVSIKISSVVFAALPLAAIIIVYRRNLSSFIKNSSVVLLFAFCIFVITNPFAFIAPHEFSASIQYESSVAFGTLPVFYTQEFLHSTPFIFQMIHVFPFLLSPFLVILVLFSFPYILILIFTRKNISVAFLLFSLTIVYLPQAILFVKWTRYMVPTLPFFYMLLGISYSWFFKKAGKLLQASFLCTASLVLLLFVISFIKTTYLSVDTRIAASNFLARQASSTHILTENYDLGILPFNEHFQNITLFNFYDLDEDKNLQDELPLLLEQSQYIILSSQRVLKTRLVEQKNFPEGSLFYKMLLAGRLGFKEVYQTPCDIFCAITYANDSIFSYEETANIFDRPTVFIFEKKKNKHQSEYQKLLQL